MIMPQEMDSGIETNLQQVKKKKILFSCQFWLYIFINSFIVLSAGLRIHQLHPLQWGKTPTKTGCPEYNTKLYLVKSLHFLSFEVYAVTSLLPVLPAPF